MNNGKGFFQLNNLIEKDIIVFNSFTMKTVLLSSKKTGRGRNMKILHKFLAFHSSWQQNRCTTGGTPQLEIIQNHLMFDKHAYIPQVITSQPKCWCVHMTALLMRSRLEKDSTRRMERSMMQLQVNNVLY